ncbi:unnamed protein product, partial [Ilex paraguariensis]
AAEKNVVLGDNGLQLQSRWNKLFRAFEVDRRERIVRRGNGDDRELPSLIRPRAERTTQAAAAAAAARRGVYLKEVGKRE